MLKRLKNKLILNPKYIFLFDGIGALSSTILLYIIVLLPNEYIGMPKIALTCLAEIALLFCFYCFICFFTLSKDWKPYLKLISTANLLYCLLTILLLIYYRQSIAMLGLAYFLIEVILIITLVFIEIKVMKNQLR